MIVTYAISLRDGGKTIVIPPFISGNDEDLLKHIRIHCETHYNSTMTFAHDYLKDRDRIIILITHKHS